MSPVSDVWRRRVVSSQATTSRQSTLAAAFGITAALFFSAACGGGSEARIAPTGPLQAPDKHGWVVTVYKGKTFTDGQELLDLRGTRPAVIQAVTVTGGTPTLEYLGASLALPSRRYTTSEEMPGYPPRVPGSTTAPAVGHTILPTRRTERRQGYELLLGYRATRDGNAVRGDVRTTVTVDYTVSGTRYRIVMPAQLFPCPKGASQGTCMKHLR